MLHLQNFLSVCVLLGSTFYLKVGEALANCPPPPRSTSDEVIKEYFVKLAVWLVVMVGIVVAMEFFLLLRRFLGIAYSYFSLGERWE